jgi:hypothetical protein
LVLATQRTRWPTFNALDCAPVICGSNRAVNPDGIRGASRLLVALQAGQGAPGARQPQAPSPSQGRSGWRSHTQPLYLQKSHLMCIATGWRGREKEPLIYLSGPHFQFKIFS